MTIDSIQKLCTLAATIACVLMMWQSIIVFTSPWVPVEALGCLENIWYIWQGKTFDRHIQWSERSRKWERYQWKTTYIPILLSYCWSSLLYHITVRVVNF